MNAIISTTQKAFRLFTLATLIIAGSLSASAANEPNDHNPGSASTAEVKYIGQLEGQPLFNVVYNNNGGDRFSIRVLDAQGDQLFQGIYSDKKFDKKFKLADADINGKLVFIIRNYKDNSVQTFEINSNTRLVEDVEVKEVK
jgi:hypothetical protein